MVTSKRDKKFSIKFELTVKGLLGVGVVCFCIFLWMFLLGIWAGQTVLTSGSYKVTKQISPRRVDTPPPAPVASAKEIEKAVPAPRMAKEPKKAAGKTNQGPDETEDPSYFAVQVAAFKAGDLAVRDVKKWHDKGYASFLRPPEGADDPFTRVYLGRFEDMTAARAFAAEVEKKEKLKPFVALIPADETGPAP